jgi:hypothetical protein
MSHGMPNLTLEDLFSRKVSATHRVRFVGGPLHNKLIDVERTALTMIIPTVEPVLGSMRRIDHIYRLRTFENHYQPAYNYSLQSGCEYVQFVHTSMLDRDGLPNLEAFHEEFPSTT